MSKRQLRTLLLEDSAADASLIEDVLMRSGLPVCVEHVDSREGFAEALKQFLPHAVLADHAVLEFDAREAASLVQATHPLAPVILVTRSTDLQTLASVFRAGIEDAVHKDDLAPLPTVLETAVTRRSRLSQLTPRQLEVLRLVAEGLSTPRIAKRLDISVKTIESHRGEIMKRLEIHDLAGLVRFAVGVRLVSPEW